MGPPAERVIEKRAVEEDFFERAAAELRPAWAPDTVGDAMADFAAAAAAERAEAEARGLALDAEPSIVVQEDLVRAAELAAAGGPEPEPRRVPPKSREAYPETYVGFAPTRPNDQTAEAGNGVGARASRSSHRGAAPVGPGHNAGSGTFAPASFPALDDAASKSVLEQGLRGAGLATLARRHARLVGIVCAACVLLAVLVASLRGSDEAPVAAPASVPAAKPAFAVPPLPIVESPISKPGAGTEAASPVSEAAAPVEPARQAVVSKKPAPAPRVIKPVVKPVAKPAPKAKLAAVKPTPKAVAKPAPKPVAKAPVAKPAKQPVKATGKGKPQASPAKRERSPVDVLNPWGN